MAGSAVALSTGDVFVIAVLVAVPFAILSFALGARRALGEIGKGQFAIEQEMPQASGTGPPPAPGEARAAEVRQMVEAKAYRQAKRGETPVDVEAEVERLLDARPEAGAPEGGSSGGRLPGPGLSGPGGDPQLRDEVRQLVIARNERRARKGEAPLDVEAEVERQLRELESLGQ